MTDDNDTIVMTIDEVIKKVNTEITHAKHYTGWHGLLRKIFSPQESRKTKKQVSETLTLACEMYDIFNFMVETKADRLYELAKARDDLYIQRRKMW